MCNVIYYTEYLAIVHKYASSAASFFAGHSGSSQSDHCTNAGFTSLKPPACNWLWKGLYILDGCACACSMYVYAFNYITGNFTSLKLLAPICGSPG